MSARDKGRFHSNVKCKIRLITVKSYKLQPSFMGQYRGKLKNLCCLLKHKEILL